MGSSCAPTACLLQGIKGGVSYTEPARTSPETNEVSVHPDTAPVLVSFMGGELPMDDINSLVTRFYDTWNAHDRDGWLACCDENITFDAPGGIAGQGLDTGRMFWSLWQDAFPDNRCTINIAVAEGNEAVQESVFTGTHTQTFHVPGSPDIPATGKSVALPYTLGLTYLNGKWSSFRLLFDRAELMTQLGLMPA